MFDLETRYWMDQMLLAWGSDVPDEWMCYWDVIGMYP